MRIVVNDIELYFDVEGAGLVPDGMTMRDRPTIVALHGGPGFDHAYFKPFLEPLTDTAQIIYLDLRCQGRSGHPPVETCTLEQMADDVAAFCRALGLVRPTILGHSAGGFVALTLAVRHPEIAGRFIFASTSAGGTGGDPAALERRAGTEGVAMAGRVFGGDFSDAAMADFYRVVVPTYLHDPSSATAGPTLAATGRSGFNAELAGYFYTHQIGRHDLRARLGRDRRADPGHRRRERLGLRAGGQPGDRRRDPRCRVGDRPRGGALPLRRAERGLHGGNPAVRRSTGAGRRRRSVSLRARPRAVGRWENGDGDECQGNNPGQPGPRRCPGATAQRAGETKTGTAFPTWQRVVMIGAPFPADGLLLSIPGWRCRAPSGRNAWQR